MYPQLTSPLLMKVVLKLIRMSAMNMRSTMRSIITNVLPCCRVSAFSSLVDESMFNLARTWIILGVGLGAWSLEVVKDQE